MFYWQDMKEDMGDVCERLCCQYRRLNKEAVPAGCRHRLNGLECCGDLCEECSAYHPFGDDGASAFDDDRTFYRTVNPESLHVEVFGVVISDSFN